MDDSGLRASPFYCEAPFAPNASVKAAGVARLPARHTQRRQSDWNMIVAA
jgi:hypothetical protein